MPTMTQATRCFSGLPLLTKYSMRCSCVKVPGSACKDWCWQAAHDMQLNSQSRSEEHTSELQSLMRISYAAFCWKKKNGQSRTHQQTKTLKAIQIITQ